MIVSPRELLRIYDFLTANVGRDSATTLIERHVGRNQLVFETKGEEVIGVATCWQVDDPNDISPTPPDTLPDIAESANGKYVYLPFLLIQKEERGNGVLKKLLSRCARICPGARRYAFRRYEAPRRKKRFGKRHPSRVHVMEVRDGT